MVCLQMTISLTGCWIRQTMILQIIGNTTGIMIDFFPIEHIASSSSENSVYATVLLLPQIRPTLQKTKVRMDCGGR